MKQASWAWPVLVLVGVQLWLAGTVELAADEAYYACWSKRLAWGYFDHPPAIAAWIRAGTSIFGATELGVRFVGITSVGLALLWLLWRGVGPKDRDLLCLLLLCTPLLFFGGVLATPDVPLVVAWIAVLILAKEEAWVGTGVALGLAVLAKATGWVLWPALILSNMRRAPRGVLIACGVGLLVCFPHLVWLVEHDFVSLVYQAERGGGSGGWVGIVGLFGGQLLMVGPVLLFAGAVYWLRGEERDLRWWSSVLLLVVVSVSALRGRSEPNWLAPAWLGTFWALSESGGRTRKAAWAGGWLAASATGLLFVHVLSPLWELPKDPLDRVHMGKTLGEAVEAWGVERAVTRRYQEASWIEFYGGIEATTIPDVGRRDQFDLWRQDLPENGVYVRRLGSSSEPEATDYYEEVGERGRVLARRKNRIVAGWEVYRVSSLR